MITVPVVLLAAGESTRFWPLREKNVFLFFGKPLLEWHYEQLVRLGVKKCIVVANSNNFEMIKHIEVPKGLQAEFVKQQGEGQGEAVKAVHAVYKEGPALIINASDVYTDEMIESLIKANQKDPKNMYIGTIEKDQYFPGGYVVTNDKGEVTKIVEKPGERNIPSNIIRIVADMIPNIQQLNTTLEKKKYSASCGYEDAMTDMMKSGMKCFVKKTTQWSCLKYPWHVQDVMEHLLRGIEKPHIHASVKIAENATIIGNVWIEAGAKIMEGVKIVGPCYIGKNAVIGNNSMVRESMIGDNVITGFNTDITRSFIGNNSWFHSNFIGDSVIGNNVSMGSGTVLANLRLDEGEISSIVKKEKINTRRNKLGVVIGNDVRIGVNCSIMPGVKIGSYSFIGAGIVVAEDVEEKMFVRGSAKLVIEKNTKTLPENRDAFRKKI